MTDESDPQHVNSTRVVTSLTITLGLCLAIVLVVVFIAAMTGLIRVWI